MNFQLGDDENGIKGNTAKDKITGSVFFDEIVITKIGVTDYNKYAIDDKPVYSTKYKIGEAEQPDQYADEYNNRVYIANLENELKVGNKFDYKNYLENELEICGNNTTKWSDVFDFDNAALQSLLGKETDVESEKIANTLASLAADADGSDMYKSPFSDLWKYYIPTRENNDKGDKDIDWLLSKSYREAYNSGKLGVTLTNQIEKSEKKKKDDD